jgi:hypothetical protein
VTRLAGNEGVGEHVRTRFQPGASPEKRRSLFSSRVRTERRRLRFFYRTGFEAMLRVTIQPLDLMSRRHPLSSVGAWPGPIERGVPSTPMTCRLKICRHQ